MKSKEKLLRKQNITEEDMKKNEDVTIEDLVEALDILTTIVLGEE